MPQIFFILLGLAALVLLSSLIVALVKIVFVVSILSLVIGAAYLIWKKEE